jgi:phytanoyl-CoA hydroxylase
VSKTPLDAALPLCASAIAHYREHGYALLRNVIPRLLRDDTARIIDPWIDHWTRQWGYSAENESIDGEFGRRFLLAWRDAGKPHFRRTPNVFLINRAMYALLHSEQLLAIAQQVLGTAELSVHGIFNTRPQLPGCAETMTPFHQDAQYWRLNYGSTPDLVGRTHVMTIWIPLQPVDEDSGALGVISTKEFGRRMIDPCDFDYKRTGFIGIAPEIIARHTIVPILMGPGDALIFTQLTPHGALRNIRDHVRWSLDVRYEATATATPSGGKFGFIAQSRTNPQSVTPVEDWIARRQA